MIDNYILSMSHVRASKIHEKNGEFLDDRWECIDSERNESFPRIVKTDTFLWLVNIEVET